MIPFIEGRPKTIDQRIEVARHLKRFHDDDGFVNGDPRLLNIVFVPKSTLIDFDFGGREEETSNIQVDTDIWWLTLSTASRMPIAKSDDVCALVQAFNKILRLEGDQRKEFCEQTDIIPWKP